MNRSPRIRAVTRCALGTALLCLLCPIAIPIGPVPLTLSVAVITLLLFLLGAKKGTVSVLVYLLLGAAGLPVFTGFSGGLSKLAGPTGGYLIGYIFFALIAGFWMERYGFRTAWSMPGLLLGMTALYFFGTAWFLLETGCTLSYALTVCVLPFLPLDCFKLGIALLLGKSIRRALRKSGLL